MWPNQGPHPPMDQPNPAFPPNYNTIFPSVPPQGVYPHAPNPGYPAGHFPAPMNPAIGPNVHPGAMPYGGPGPQAYPVAPVVVVHPGPCPLSPKGDHHKGHHMDHHKGHNMDHHKGHHKDNHKGHNKGHHKELHPAAGGFAGGLTGGLAGVGLGLAGQHVHKKMKKMKKKKGLKSHKHGHFKHGKSSSSSSSSSSSDSD